MDDSEFEEFHVVLMEDVSAERERRLRAQRSQQLEALGQLVGGVAHDFNNLLMVIQTQVELARAMPPTEQDAIGNEILAATQRGSRLTRQLLAFARQQVLAPERTDVVELFGQTLTLLGRTLGAHHPIQLRDDVPDAAVAMCDPGQLEAALVNLALNARDATEPGHEIEVGIALLTLAHPRPCGPELLPPGRYVAISVEDDGPGISEAVAERIWEPFVSSKNPGTHSGLGLSMVLGFALQSGGGAEVGPGRGGRGTKATIYLPAATAS